MQEKVVNRRKSFFLPFSPFEISLDDRIRPKLRPGEFPTTKTAWIKIASILSCIVAAIGFFESQTWAQCDNVKKWFKYVLPISAGCNAGMQLVFYLIFSFGLTVHRPGKWIQFDIVVNIILALSSITGAIMSVASGISCTENRSMHTVPLYLAIAGAGVCLVGCAAIFLKYRYVNLTQESNVRPTSTPALSTEEDFA